MDYKLTSILVLLLLASSCSCSSSSSPSYSPSYSPYFSYSSFSPATYHSTLSSILSLLANNEGEPAENIKRSPQLFLLSRLLSRTSADQQGVAGMDPSLLSLKDLLTAVEKEIARLDKGGVRKSAMKAGLWVDEMGFGEQMGEARKDEEKQEEGRGMEEDQETEEKNTETGETELGEEQRRVKLSKKSTSLRKIDDGEIEAKEEKITEMDEVRKEEEREKTKEKEEIEAKMEGHENREKEDDGEEDEEDQGKRKEEKGEREERLKENNENEERRKQKTNNEGETKDETTDKEKEDGEEGKKEDKEEGKTEMKGELSQIRRKRKTDRKPRSSAQDENPSGEDGEDDAKFPGQDAIIEKIKEAVKELIEHIKLTINQGFHHLLYYYLPNNSTGDISEECAIDVADGSLLAPVNRWWFIKMVDSWGKLPDGFLWGNINVMGMYEECITMKASTIAAVDGENVTREYAGRYCAVTYRPNSTAEEEEEEEEGRGRRYVGPSVRSSVSLATLANPLPFAYGTCIPSTCTEEDLEASLAVVLAQDGMEVAGVYCQTEEREDTELIPEDKAFISIMAIFGILALLGTIYEVIVIIRKIGSFELILNFSLLRNMSRVFTYESKKETGDVITCLPMLRVVTMLWIIICHQYETNTTFIANLFDSLTYQEPLMAQVVTNGWLSVDTFFFMAGLIFAFRLIPYMRREAGLVNNAKIIVIVIVRRIVRLAPVILVVALFCASLLRFLAHGPNARVLESYSQDLCQKHWWKDPLFINNYLYADNVGEEVNDCLSHCWYTAVDVQLLVLLPVIFLTAVYKSLAGVAVMCVLTVASVVVPLAITLAYDLPPSPLHHVLGEKHLEYTTHMFMAPWCRMAPWLVGIWTGILLRTNRARTIKLSKLVVFVGYVIAIALGLVLVHGIVAFNRLHFSTELVAKKWQDYPVVAAFYGSLSKPAWGLCLAWVVFTCHTGNADIINKILSYPGWLPVARLTFIMYLVSPVVQIWWATGLLIPTYFNYLGKLLESAGVFAISLLLALILTCLIELPIISTFNLLLPSPAKKHERVVVANKNNSDSNNMQKGWTDATESTKIFPL